MLFRLVFRRSLIAVLLVASAAYGEDSKPVPAVSMTLQEALAGNKIPPSLSIDSLTPEYKAIELLNSPRIPSHRLNAFKAKSRRAATASFWNVLWTKFQKVTVEGHPSLVCYGAAYGWEPEGRRYASLFPVLQLNLVNLDSGAGYRLANGSASADFLKKLAQARRQGKRDFPVFQVAREHALRTHTVSNLKQLAMLLMIYAQDHGERLPSGSTSSAVLAQLKDYVKSPAIRQTLNPKGGTIRFNMALAGKGLGSFQDPAKMVMLTESRSWPDGFRCVAYADGHAVALDRRDARRLR